MVDGEITYTNLYLERVLYGNKTPYQQFGDDFPKKGNFFFETVFDYGSTFSKENLETIEEWDFRPDSCSNDKPGFEVRTTRISKRVLLFHRFDVDEYNGLVCSINFE